MAIVRDEAFYRDKINSFKKLGDQGGIDFYTTELNKYLASQPKPVTTTAPQQGIVWDETLMGPKPGGTITQPKPITQAITQPKPVTQIIPTAPITTVNQPKSMVSPSPAVYNPQPAPVAPAPTGTALRDVANQYNYNIDYDPASNKVKVINPATNKEINFVSGQGSQYGIGNFTGGTNYVTDLNMLQSALNAAPQQPSPVKVNSNDFMEANLQRALGQFIPQGETLQSALDKAIESGNVTLGQPAPRIDYEPQKGIVDPRLYELAGMFQPPAPVARDPVQELNAYDNQTPQYNSPYEKEMIELLRELQKRQFSYDPASDAGLQVAQRQAIDAVNRDMARRNRLGSNFTESQAIQSAAGLIPQFQRDAYGQYADERSNMYKNLSLLQGFDDRAYNRFRDSVSDERDMQDREFKAQQAQTSAAFNDSINEIKYLSALADYENKINPDSLENRKRIAEIQKLEAQAEEAWRLLPYAPKEAQANLDLINARIRDINSNISNRDFDNAMKQAEFEYKQSKGISEEQPLAYKDYFLMGKEMRNKYNSDKDRIVEDIDILRWAINLPLDQDKRERLILDLGISEEALIQLQREQNIKNLPGYDWTKSPIPGGSTTPYNFYSPGGK